MQAGGGAMRSSSPLYLEIRKRNGHPFVVVDLTHPGVVPNMIRQSLFVARNGPVKLVLQKVSGGQWKPPPYSPRWPGAAIKNDRLIGLETVTYLWICLAPPFITGVLHDI